MWTVHLGQLDDDARLRRGKGTCSRTGAATSGRGHRGDVRPWPWMSGAVVAAWLAVAWVRSLKTVILNEQMPAVTPGAHNDGPETDPVSEHTAIACVADLVVDRLPSTREGDGVRQRLASQS